MVPFENTSHLEVFFHVTLRYDRCMKLWSAAIGVCLGWSVFLFAHHFFMSLNFYWYTWWADTLMHAGGGVLIVSTWYVIFHYQIFPRALRLVFFHPLLILLAMVVGWEVFEYVYGLVTPVGYALDTLIDLGLGFGGGLMVFLLCRSGTIR